MSNMNLSRQFGKHMALDFKGSDYVDCPETITKFVDELVRDLKMTKYQGLHLMKFGEDPRVAGYSFFQLIMESNVSGHLCSEDCMLEGVDENGNTYVYNNKGSGYIDIFSCKMYDAQTAIDCVERHFKPKSIVYKENDRI